LIRVGKVKLLKSSFIIFLILPIVAKSIETYEISMEIPFSWLMLYYSTLFISLGIFFYAIFCPDIVKRFNNYEDFMKSGRGGSYLNIQLSMFYSKKINDQHKLAEYLSAEYKFAHFKNESGIKNIIDSDIWNGDKDSFWFVHDCLNYSRQYIRLLCNIFYGIGFILLAIVLTEKIITVTKYLITIT